MRALFLTWDGPQQSYLESLFFPIFSGLRSRDIEVQVLQLTWASAAQLAPVKAAADARGIRYESRRIPPALRLLALPALVAYGAGVALQQCRQQQVDALFPRSLIPMSMALAVRAVWPSLPLLFDADGFMADERVDFGNWQTTDLKYRALRRVEARGVRQARSVICRTQQARSLLAERARFEPSEVEKIFVAPNAKDGAVFRSQLAPARAATRARHGVSELAPWVVYVGSLGPQYCPELMLDCFVRIRERRPDARFSCFTFQRALLEPLLRSRGLSDAVEVEQLPPAQVAEVLAASDLGLALRLEAPSQRGICPIKLSEYLLSGVPVVATSVGDLESQLGGSGAALLVDSGAAQASQQVADWFVQHVLVDREARRSEARELGLRWFELARCVETYACALRYGT